MRILGLVCAMLCFPASAANLSLTVFNSGGEPVENAVVLIYADDRDNAPSSHASNAEMRQQDKQFAPHVLAVHVDTQVSFPNADNVKHHVYSFSDAKTFELELYDDFAGTPITFDKAGIVELGCNIHDWMLGYIYVTNADYFTTTSTEGTMIFDLPNGDYTVKLWHPRAQHIDTARAWSLSMDGEQSMVLSFENEFDEALDFSSGFDDY